MQSVLALCGCELPIFAPICNPDNP